MTNADIDIAMKMIWDMSCLHLHQSLVTGAPEVVEPNTEVPGGWEFLHSLPEQKQKEEEWQMIITLFDHVSEAHAHASSTTAYVSALGKIMDPQTFDCVTSGGSPHGADKHTQEVSQSSTGPKANKYSRGPAREDQENVATEG